MDGYNRSAPAKPTSLTFSAATATIREMSYWNGKYVIGLTGNIATGKSVVRRMLEHLGAFGIDADSLAHQTIDTGTPGYARVVQAFGQEILDANGQVNRGRLGKVVFSDTQALQSLEAIVHPLVMELIEQIMRQARHPVVVIEAIKIIESGLHKKCDSLWVVDSQREIQIRRLVKKRAFSHEAALQRMLAQPSQEMKIAQADLVIVNNGAFEETWRQVKNAWDTTVPEQWKEHIAISDDPGISLRQTTPEQAEAIAHWINLHTSTGGLSPEGFLGRFADRAYLEIVWNGQTSGFLGWKTDHFIASVSELYLDQNLKPENLVDDLLAQLEESACQNLCELVVFSLPGGSGRFADAFEKQGYRLFPIDVPEIRAWREAATAQKIPDSAWWKPLLKEVGARD